MDAVDKEAKMSKGERLISWSVVVLLVAAGAVNAIIDCADIRLVLVAALALIVLAVVLAVAVKIYLKG